ncbi:MAG: hypothetical protein ACXWWG_00660 [Nitrospira sp.]
MIEAGIEGAPISDGQIGYSKPVRKPLPEAGFVKRYIVTSAQNNTDPHVKLLDNIEAYAKFLKAEVLVCAFSYNKTAYAHARPLVPRPENRSDARAELVYSDRIKPYIVNMGPRETRAILLAPDLMLCGELDILPTAAEPMKSLDGYGGGTTSIIVPHSKIALKSVATAKGDDPKFIYTTGTITQRNYIQRLTGQKAEFHHSYGALVVEVQSDGSWWVRQLNAKNDGSFMDCPEGAEGVVTVSGGIVIQGGRAEALSLGDVHASEIDEDVAQSVWSREGWNGDYSLIDALEPKYQFLHDLLSFRSRSHHDRKDPAKMLAKHYLGMSLDIVEKEVEETVAIMEMAHRDSCTTIVVNSNHDRHGERWINEADWREDPANAVFLLEAQLAQAQAIAEAATQRGEESTWQFHEWALKSRGAPAARFLGRDEGFRICGNIECGWHGDEGPNGSRGSTRAFKHVGVRVNKGHDHTAAIMDNVYSAGACARSYSYQHGPSAHSVSHIVTYPNGKRQIVTYRNDQWRAQGKPSKK